MAIIRNTYTDALFNGLMAAGCTIYGACGAMEDAIRRDDLVVMRRCQDPEYYVKYLRESRKKLDKILGSPILEPKLREGQLTIWDFIGGQ